MRHHAGPPREASSGNMSARRGYLALGSAWQRATALTSVGLLALSFVSCSDASGGAGGGGPNTGGAAGSAGTANGASGGSSTGGRGTGGSSGSAGSGGGAGGQCPLGTLCNPILVDTFPYVDSGTTLGAASDELNSYACAQATDESGPEVVYRVSLAEPGTLIAAVTDDAGVDVDLQLLDAPSADACVARGDTEVSRSLAAGDYFVIVDTWVNAQAEEQAGAYQLDISFAPTSAGGCATYPLDLKMFWPSCDASLDCFEAVDPADGQTYRYLRTPAIGPVVKEAHLVTVQEAFPSGWPTSFTDQINRHYSVSEAVSGYVMDRAEPWAPAGEGGSEFGQGSTSVPLPVDAEAWYVNMYWRVRPAAGTRMIIRNPANGRAVVAAAGYETGPGSNTAVGGVAEEVHHYLGTSHRGDLELGFAVDDSLPYGPISCD